jgi:hypothetical protein
MRELATNLSVSGDVGSKLTCERRCERRLLTLVSGGVASKSTCERRCARRLLILVCLVV